jgi:hypothetical protein
MTANRVEPGWERGGYKQRKADRGTENTFLETSVNNYHTTPRNIPEERRSHQHRDGSLKSRLFYIVWLAALRNFDCHIIRLQQTKTREECGKRKYCQILMSAIVLSQFWRLPWELTWRLECSTDYLSAINYSCDEGREGVNSFRVYNINSFHAGI